jgi:hypothetical protein
MVVAIPFISLAALLTVFAPGPSAGSRTADLSMLNHVFRIV